MGISSISYLSGLISYDALLSEVVASFVVLLILFILSGINDDDKNNEHDKELFKQPPPAEDCPICFLRLPSLRAVEI